MKKSPHEKKLNYLLRDIPPSLWRRAKHVGVEEEVTLRELLLKALDKYCESKKGRIKDDD